MQNSYEDLIQIIDIILRKMELTDKKVVGLLITEFSTSGGPEHPANRIKFFQRLKESGAIKDFDVMELGKAPFGFTLTQPNKQRLIEERNQLINFDQVQPLKRSSAHSSENKGLIRNLELVKPKIGNRFKIVVDDDYLNPVPADKTKPSWDLLFRVAEKDIVEAEGHKASLDYFNSNKGCRLYTKTGYQITKILKVEGGYILPAIEIRVITEKAFQQRANKSTKAA